VWVMCERMIGEEGCHTILIAPSPCDFCFSLARE
jgi:hypothetical protein